MTSSSPCSPGPCASMGSTDPEGLPAITQMLRQKVLGQAIMLAMGDWPSSGSNSGIAEMFIHTAEKMRSACKEALKTFGNDDPHAEHLDIWGRAMLDWVPRGIDWLQPVRVVHIAVGDGDRFSFPAFVMPKRVSDVIVDPATMDELIRRPGCEIRGRFAGLVHVCDDFVHALKLEVGHMSVNDTDDECTYRVRVPPDYPRHHVETFIVAVAEHASLFRETKSARNMSESRSAALDMAMPYCPVTGAPAFQRCTQKGHLIANRVGPPLYEWLMKSYHEEAKEKNRYDPGLLTKWDQTDWKTELSRHSNIANVGTSLNVGNPGEHWCLVPLIQTSADALLTPSTARFLPRWYDNDVFIQQHEPTPYVFWNLGGMKLPLYDEWLQLGTDGAPRFPSDASKDLTGLQAVWTKEARQAQPWRPTSMITPLQPPFAWDASLPQRVLATYGTNAVNAFAALVDAHASDLRRQYVDASTPADFAPLDSGDGHNDLDRPRRKRQRTDHGGGEDNTGLRSNSGRADEDTMSGLKAHDRDGGAATASPPTTAMAGTTGTDSRRHVSKGSRGECLQHDLEALVAVGLMLLAAVHVSSAREYDDSEVGSDSEYEPANPSPLPRKTINRIEHWAAEVASATATRTAVPS